MHKVKFYDCGCILPLVQEHEEYPKGYAHACEWCVNFLSAYEKTRKSLQPKNYRWYNEIYLPDLNKTYREHFEMPYVVKTVYDSEDIRVLVPQDKPSAEELVKELKKDAEKGIDK